MKAGWLSVDYTALNPEDNTLQNNVNFVHSFANMKI
jgi:hypothetical protein